MSALWSILSQHWLSALLLLGTLAAIRYVFKNKDKLLYGGDQRK